METPYINIHTHQATDETNTIECTSYHLQNTTHPTLRPAYNQVGMHPWHLNHLENQKTLLQKLAQQTNVCCIGECGLDKRQGAEFSIQTNAFLFQIQLAQKLHKPLIIHCVKAYQEILSILKQANFTSPVIFHGFIGSPQLAQQITQQGYYLSIGAHLQNNTKLAQTLSTIPLHRLFLETDTSTTPITQIYKTASTLLNLPLNTLKTRIHDNFNTLFSSS